MKKIQKEVVIKRYDTMFVANDGTEFTTEEECKKYEESAKCALMARYNLLVIKESDCFSLFGFGSDEDVINVVKVESKEDINLILQLLIIDNPWHYDENKAENPDAAASKKENLRKVTERLTKALQEKDLIFIGRGYDSDGFYFEGTRNEHIRVLENIGKEKSESETGE